MHAIHGKHLHASTFFVKHHQPGPTNHVHRRPPRHAANWIDMRSTDDDADGVATKLTFYEDDHTTHDGAGSSGLLAARALAATLSTAHSEVAWLPMENAATAIPHFVLAKKPDP